MSIKWWCLRGRGRGSQPVNGVFSELLMIFPGADDVFVRRDLLRSKYSLVDYEAAEQYGWFCRHYRHSDCPLTNIGQAALGSSAALQAELYTFSFFYRERNLSC